VQSVWATAAREVGTYATPHDLRRYFASEQLRHGCSTKKLQAMLGHKSAVGTLDIYGHLIGDVDDRSREIMQEALGETCGQSRRFGHVRKFGAVSTIDASSVSGEARDDRRNSAAS
jgi:hypothetical protein